MSDLDEFARSVVAPTLHPGEVLLSIGWMAPSASNWRDQPTRYFAVGTSQRLVVIQTGTGLMWGGPKAENQGIQGFALGQLGLARVAEGALMAQFLSVQHPGGQAQYAVPSPSIVGAKSVEGHPDFVNTYLPWLCRHVAAGSFRTPEGAAAAAAEWQNRAALVAGNERYYVQIGSGRAKSTRPVTWPMIVGALLLLIALPGFKKRIDAGDRITSTERHMQFLRDNADLPGKEWDLETELANDRATIDKMKSAQTQGALLIAAGIAGLLAGFVVTIVLTSKKRKAARAAAA